MTGTCKGNEVVVGDDVYSLTYNDHTYGLIKVSKLPNVSANGKCINRQLGDDIHLAVFNNAAVLISKKPTGVYIYPVSQDLSLGTAIVLLPNDTVIYVNPPITPDNNDCGLDSIYAC